MPGIGYCFRLLDEAIEGLNQRFQEHQIGYQFQAGQLEVWLGFVPKSLIAYEYSHRWLMKPFKKCHKSGCIASFMHFSSELLLLLSPPRLACEATLWAYERF